MANHKIFAADFGASGGKCFAGIFEGNSFELREVHRFAHEAVNFYLPDTSGKLVERAYWDDTHLYHNMVEGLAAFRRDVAENVDAIGIDTWGADGHLLTADGDLLGKVYAYRDHRLDGMIDEIKQRIDATKIYEITGIHFQPFNVSNQLRWLVQNRPEFLMEGARYYPIPSLFYYYLGGEWKVDSTFASVTQLMDARRGDWSDEVLDALEIPRRLLPAIAAPGERVGALSQPLARKVGLNSAPLIAVGAHDTASAFAAAPVDDPDKALIISSGTWSLVGMRIPEPITSPAAMDANMSNEGGIGDIRFLKNCMGTWLVQELRRVWRLADGKELDWDEITRLTAEAPAFESVLYVNDPSFYNPANMEEAIREFCQRTGQSQPGSRGAILRAVYEGLGLYYREILESINAITGKQCEVVHIVGGGCKNRLLNQFTADATGLPVLAGPDEATAAGNLMVQAKGLGIIPTMHDALPLIQSAFAIDRYEPSDTAAWQQAYGRYRQVVDSL